MSPISNPDPCPHVVQKGTFYFCGRYDMRPKECVNHSFPSHVCPIGMDKLKIRDAEGMRQRVDAGHAIITNSQHNMEN